MGTWDTGPLGTDTAGDFSYRVDGAPVEKRAEVPRGAFREVTDTGCGYQGAGVTVEAIASAALLAAQRPGGKPVTASYDYRPWIALKHPLKERKGTGPRSAECSVTAERDRAEPPSPAPSGRARSGAGTPSA
ncbi:DUF4259 domain-containing protein [Streptomyces sp. NPDC012825]|uniref:DUF4259 domain-containing protein n=1 Tax=Streptomyces sp. NPDC012825 TaxID=3364851 RepID=UPI0036BF3CEB